MSTARNRKLPLESNAERDMKIIMSAGCPEVGSRRNVLDPGRRPPAVLYAKFVSQV